MKQIIFLVFTFTVLIASAATFIKGPALIEGVTTTATAAGTTTLTKDSETIQVFTGATTQSVVLPDATTLPNGRRFEIKNRSTGTVTVKYNDASTVRTVIGNMQANFILRSNGTTNGTWDIENVKLDISDTTNAITGSLPLTNLAGATGALVYGTSSTASASDASNLFWDSSAKKLGIGTNAPQTALQVKGASLLGEITIDRTDGVAPLLLQYSNGNTAIPTTTATGQVSFRGYGTTGFVTGALIQATTTQQYSDTAAGTKLDFYTTPNNSTTNAIAFTLNQDKTATFASTVTATGLTLSTTPLAIGSGGTGAATKSAAFDALSPMTTGGDLIYGGASGTGTRLANGSAGAILRSAGGTSAPAWTTATYPATTTINQILYSSAANTVGGITAAATSALVSNSSSVPSWTSGSVANRLLRTNGTAVSFAQADLTTDVTGILPVANGGTGGSGGAWTTGNPTYSVGGVVGFATTSATGRYLQIGKLVHFNASVTGTWSSGSPGTVTITIPGGFSANTTNLQICYGRNVTNGSMVQGISSAGSPTLITLFKYDNTAPVATSGDNLVISCALEVQ